MKALKIIPTFYHKFQEMDVNGLKLYISYETVVGFVENGAWFVSENIWGNTTGRHLNSVMPNKNDRIKHSKFKVILDNVLRMHGIVFG